jgi:hypothetical protein
MESRPRCVASTGPLNRRSDEEVSVTELLNREAQAQKTREVSRVIKDLDDEGRASVEWQIKRQKDG